MLNKLIITNLITKPTHHRRDLAIKDIMRHITCQMIENLYILATCVKDSCDALIGKQSPKSAKIKTINKWCVGVDVFWCQGPLFDYAILQNLYTQLGHPQPWQYWQIRDSRTLFSLVPRDPNEKRTGLHNALEDCYFQAKKVQRVYKQLGIKNVRY